MGLDAETSHASITHQRSPIASRRRIDPRVWSAYGAQSRQYPSLDASSTVLTRTAPLRTEALRPRDIAQWRILRNELDDRHETRRIQLRFRRDPDGYLRVLEERLLKLGLPA